MNIINSTLIKSINDIIKSKKKDKNIEIEKEFDINKNKQEINYEIYLKLVRYLNTLKKKLTKELITTKTINLSYNNLHNEDELNNYRIEFDNKYLNSCIENFKNTKSKNIYLSLLNKILNNSKSSEFNIIRKNRNNKKDIIDINDYNVRFRCNIEEKINNISDINKLINVIKGDNDFKLSSRQKIRHSLILDTIKIELTQTITLNEIEAKKGIYPLLQYINLKK